MTKFIACLCMLAFTVFGEIQAQVKTTLSAQIYGYQGEMVYFDCAQSPLISQEFHTNPGEDHIFSFDTKKLVCMVINGKTNVLLEPGDSLHVNIQYEGNKVRSVEFSGTPAAVTHNQTFNNVGKLKVDLRYKSQLLGCAVLDIKPEKRIADSKTLVERVKAMVSNPEKKVSEAVANYIMAEVESEACMSYMEYPVMYAEIRKTPIEKMNIGDYWKIMDDYIVRTDESSLSSMGYANMLMRYCFYQNEKKAVAEGKTYEMPKKLEGMYEEIAKTFDGSVRDFVLYRLICNFIQGGQEIERADALYSDYKAKYNKNPEYIQILETLLQ